MPQKFGLYEDLSVIQNLRLYADLRGVVGKERTDAFERLLKFTGLSPFQDRLAGNLSGGMKQKLGLACALVRKPSLLLLDEPSVGVDPISRRELWKMVRDLIDDGISVLWSTSYLDEAERCDSVLLLSGGKLLYNGPPKELTKTLDGRVFRLHDIDGQRRKLLMEVLEQKNVVDGTIQGSDIRLVFGKDAPATLNISSNIPLEPIPPRFEDAFVDMLGGCPKEKSKLAERTPAISSPSPIAITANGLTKKFGSFTAADHITFSVKRGEIFGLLGPNGAGKSTTFKMLCGLLKPTEGTCSVNDLDLQKAPAAARSRFGYMAQKFSLYGDLSVKQNLEFFAGIYNLQNQDRKLAVEQMVEIFNFQGYLGDSSDSLPLGFKQRLSLACATMHHPEVLFLDEPTSGVDPIARREFWNHINGLIAKHVTIMVTTHFMDEAEYCDRIGLVYRGKIIHLDTPDALKATAKSQDNPEPTLECAFIKLIEEYDAQHPV